MQDTNQITTGPDGSGVHQSIGVLTRQLHDALSGLGMTNKVKGLAEEMPDAQSRLSYIARLTGEAAEKVLNHVDIIKSIDDGIASEAQQVLAAIESGSFAQSEDMILTFLRGLKASTSTIDDRLTDIMMAQDFHDLTGQVISRVVTLAANIEKQLVQLMIQTAPEAPVNVAKATSSEFGSLLHGPVVSQEVSADVVANQSEVDALLADFGF